MSITPLAGLTPMVTTPSNSSTSTSTSGSNSTGKTSNTKSSNNGTGTSSSTSNITKQLDNPQMFLQLLVAELQNQNPDNPTNPSTILSQTSELAQMEALQTQTTAITTQQTTSQDNEAAGLIGMTVTAKVSGNSVTGAVTAVTLSSGGAPTLTVNGTSVPLADVTQVTGASAGTTSTTSGG